MLLGAGISIPAGFPTTQDITSRILSGHNITRHSDGTYYLDEDQSPLRTFEIPVQRDVLLLRRLRMEIEKYFLYDFSLDVNYEDLYYLCSQIHDSTLGEYENPLVGPFLQEISPDVDRIRTLTLGGNLESWEEIRLFSEAMYYIRDVTWRLLQLVPTQLDYLGLIRELCMDADIERVDLLSLNHDTLLEEFLADSGIEFADGFGEPAEEVRYWQEGLLAGSDAKVRLLKLHGSIDWFKYPPNAMTSGPEAVGMPLTDDIWHTKNPSGEMQTPYGGRPVLLAGTFNKMLEYTSSIYADLHCQFRESIRAGSRLVISGYGFGDKGVNSQIVEWMYQAESNTICLIHPDPSACRRKSRGVILKHWDKWLSAGRLKIVEGGIGDANWEDIKRLILDD